MGIFDKSSTSSSSTSASQTTPQTGTLSSGSAIGLGNINISSGKKGSTTSEITVNNVLSDHGAVDSAFSFGSDVLDLADRVDNRANTANLEFLGKVSDFADLSSQTALSMAKQSELQAQDAISAVVKSQNTALDYGAKFAQDAQSASLKALDYVYESSKSETARLADNSLKWIVGAAVLVAMIPVFMRMK